jgi:hypothetical protein
MPTYFRLFIGRSSLDLGRLLSTATHTTPKGRPFIMRGDDIGLHVVAIALKSRTPT